MQNDQEPVNVEMQESGHEQSVPDQRYMYEPDAASPQSNLLDEKVPGGQITTKAEDGNNQIQGVEAAIWPSTIGNIGQTRDTAFGQLRFLNDSMQQMQKEIELLRAEVAKKQDEEKIFVNETLVQEMRDFFQKAETYQNKQKFFEEDLTSFLGKNIERIDSNMNILYERENQVFSDIRSLDQSIQKLFQEVKQNSVYVNSSINNSEKHMIELINRKINSGGQANRSNAEERMQDAIVLIHSKLQTVEQIHQMASKLLEQQEAFSEKLERILANVQLITVLHEEIQKYNEDVQFVILKPVFGDLITLYEEIDRAIEALAINNQGRRPKLEVKGYEALQDDIESTLSRLGVEVFDTEGDVYQSGKQKIISRVTTPDQNKNDRIAKRVRSGFSYKNYILRQELIRIYKYT